MEGKRFLELQKLHIIIPAIEGIIIEPKNNGLYNMCAFIDVEGNVQWQVSDEALQSKQHTDLHDYVMAVKRAMEG